MNDTGNKWLQHIILLTGPLLAVIDVFIVNIAVPSIKHSLSASDGEVELVIAAYLLGYASFQITGGRAGDIFGRKTIFFWGMFFFVLSSALCGVAVNIEMLIIARFFQGLSGAFMTPQSLAYLQILFPQVKERTKAVGMVGITLGLASILGQFLGGYFSEFKSLIEGWRFIFFINIPVGIVSLWATSRYLVNTPQNLKERFDYSGVALLTLTLGCLIFPLTVGRELGWPWWSLLLVCLSFILVFILLTDQKRKQRQGRSLLIDLRLFQIKDFNLGILVVIFYFMVHTSYLLVSTIYLQNGLHYSPFQAGMFFVCAGVCFILSSFISIRLVQRFGKLPILIGTLLLICCYGLQAYFFDDRVSETLLITVLMLWGIAGGMVLPSLINITLKNVPRQFVGIASGVYNTVQQAASSIGICLIGGLFFAFSASRSDVVAAFHYSLYAGLLCLMVIVVLLFRIDDFKK
ncbi:MAG: MFS transporter [Chitinophagaceae bacterium]